MYNTDKYTLGQYEVLTVGIENGPQIELIPEQGGVLHQIYLDAERIPLLNQFKDEKDLQQNPIYKQAILFPFPNRLKDGVYSFRDTAYRFPINEPDRQNALHGLVYDKEFVVTQLDLFEDYGSVELSLIYHGQDESYPFPFTLRITYSISDSGFEMNVVVENTGYSELPYGFGWHPYFKTDSVARIKAPMASLQEINQRFLPIGSETLYNFNSELKELQERLDNAFRLQDNSEFEIAIADFGGKTILLNADNSYKFFQIYQPEDDIIAVEPVTSNINALNTKDELIILPKGESKEHKLSLSLS